MAIVIALSLNFCSFATNTDTDDTSAEPVDRGGKVTRVDIPNGDGTFTTLKGDEAQEWYDNMGEEDEQSDEEESSTEITKDKIETKGSFHYKYRYIESKRTKDVERHDLEKKVTNRLRNETSATQTYTLNLSVSQSWSISPSVEKKYKDAVKATLGGSWGKTYSKTESLTINIKPHKTVWVTFVPIMDKSVGKAQKYYIPRGVPNKKPIVEKSYNITTYNPKYLTTKIGKFKMKTVYGTYIWHEQ